MLYITPTLSIPLSDVEFQAIRAQGAGGQNVNKVSSAVHLRFDVRASSLPEVYKERLLALRDSRLNNDGVIVIKAQQYRSQEKNKAEGLERLAAIIEKATHTQKRRRPTRPGKRARARRMDGKTRRGQTKTLRGKVDY